MAKLAMAFFLTEQYKVPKPSRFFWMCHWLGWGTFALINFLISIIAEGDFYRGILGFFLILTTNTIVCLKLRELIHGKQLLTLPLNKIWGKLGLYSTALAFISTTNIIVTMALFLWLRGEPLGIFLFFLAILINWFLMSLFIFLWGLIYVSVKYSNQLREAKQTSSELALELRNAQLNTLMAQLNPHFLFNALNNIRALMLEDVSKSREMLTRLAEMLRYSLLSDKQEFETLDNELGVVRAYLKLASIQYEERLQYVEDIDIAMLNCDIPPMLIQMLIENAVKYGIDQTTIGGEIKLTIFSLDDKIVIHVSNPGGLQSENLESTGLGVKNIQKRLSLLYGDAASFSIRQEGSNVVATVILPFSQEPSAAVNKEPSAAVNKEPSAAVNKEPSAAVNKEPSAAVNKEPSVAVIKEPSLQ